MAVNLFNLWSATVCECMLNLMHDVTSPAHILTKKVELVAWAVSALYMR